MIDPDLGGPVPTLLDDALVKDSLEALPGWQGTPERLSRTVHLAPEQDARLREQVAETADAMDHHPVVEQDGDGTRFVLSTHSKGGVTELDITLASRINDLLHHLTGERPDVAAESRDDAPEQVTSADRSVGPVDGGAASSESGTDQGEAPTIGVRSSAQDDPSTPLPDASPGAPEPGVNAEQEPGRL